MRPLSELEKIILKIVYTHPNGISLTELKRIISDPIELNKHMQLFERKRSKKETK